MHGAQSKHEVDPAPKRCDELPSQLKHNSVVQAIEKDVQGYNMVDTDTIAVPPMSDWCMRPGLGKHC